LERSDGPRDASKSSYRATLQAIDERLRAGSPVDARKLAGEAMRVCRDAPPASGLHGRVLLRLAYCDLALSRAGRAYDSATEAARLLRVAGIPDEEVSALSLVAVTAGRLGRAVEAVEAAALAAQLAEELPAGRWASQAHCSLGVAYSWSQSFAKGEQAFDKAAELASRLRPADGLLEVLVGRMLAEVFRLAHDRNATKRLPDLRPLEALVRRTGELTASERPDVLTPGGGRDIARACTIAAGLLACWRGNVEDARATLPQRSTEAQPDTPNWVRALQAWLLIEQSCRAGGMAEAVVHANDMIAAATEAEHEPLACLGHQLLCHLHEGTGRLDLALGELRKLEQRQRAHQARELGGRAAVVQSQVQLRSHERSIEALTVQSQEFERLAFEDALTGIANVRRFHQRLAEWTAASADSGEALCAAVIDVDQFKRVNDDFSHETGDDVLKTVASVMASQVRDGDLPARLGGDEFAILFRNADEAAARQVCERIENGVRDHDWSSLAQGLSVSISVGVVQARAGDAAKDLVRRSDDAMYARKRSPERRLRRAARLDNATVPPMLLERVLRLFARAQSVVIFTGSGQLAAGGPQWAHDQRFLHADGYEHDRQAFLAYWHRRRSDMADAVPTDVHRLLVELSHLKPSTTFVTERVDGALAKAGAGHVIELYGNLFRGRCGACGSVFEAQTDGGCPACRTLQPSVRPDIVLFGELPSGRLQGGAELAAKRADLVLAVDTDAHVFPGASLLEKARIRGAQVVMLGAGAHARASGNICIGAPPAGVLSTLLERLREGDSRALAGSELTDDGFAALCYLSGYGTDHVGRTLDQTLAWSDWDIQRQSDSTQWQFPLPTRSQICPEAPVLTRQDFAVLAQNEDVRNGMQRAFVRMLQYYGFEWTHGHVEKGDGWSQSSVVWALRAGPDDLRISRILGALTLCGLDAQAAAFLAVLEREIPRVRILGGGEAAMGRTLSYWRQAVKS
jgi:diguanylate cyclase (GGDEF)-like protein